MEKLSQNLLEIINKKEKETTEFKKAEYNLPDNLFETVCAMLNRSGGHIFLGIADDGTILGVDKNSVSKMKKDFANLCNNKNKLNPTSYISIYDYEYEDKVILYIPVFESDLVHSTKGEVFDRNVDGDYKVTSPERIANIYARKQKVNTEDELFPYAKMSDLRPDLIKRARQMAINNSQNTHIWANMTDEEMLRSLDFLRTDLKTGQEGLTLAAILLFGKDTTILSALPQHRTDAIYRVKNLDRYDDRDDIRTNLIESYDRLMEFVDKHLNDMFYLEGSQRIDVRNKIAREICSNSLMHREFTSAFPAKLVIEKDKMWTENANKAKRIGDININKFSPYSKNPKIAKVFKEIGLADELGSGVRNIVKYTKIYSGGEPTFEENDIFTTTIPLKKTINVSETNSIEISKGQNELLNDPLNDLLDDTQNKILNLIKDNNSLTYDEISNQLNISSSTVKRKIKEMKELDIIIRVNGKRDGYWKILK